MRIRRIFFTFLILLAPAASLLQAQSFLPAGFPIFTDAGHFTMKSLAGYMKKNFEFVDDYTLFGEIDYWQSPEEFWTSRRGDCEDYALFTQSILESQGIESYVVSFYDNTGYGHTVTVIRDGDTYNVMNEDRFYEYKAATIEEALTKVHPTWVWGGIAEKRETRGWMLQKLTNPAFQKI